MNLLITGTFYASDMKNINNKSNYDAVLQASKLLRIQDYFNHQVYNQINE